MDLVLKEPTLSEPLRQRMVEWLRADSSRRELGDWGLTLLPDLGVEFSVSLQQGKTLYEGTGPDLETAVKAALDKAEAVN